LTNPPCLTTPARIATPRAASRPGAAEDAVHARPARRAAPQAAECPLERGLEAVEIPADVAGREPEVVEPGEQAGAHLPGTVRNRTAAAAHEPYRQPPGHELIVGQPNVRPRTLPADRDRRLELADHERRPTAPRLRHLAGEPLGHLGVGVDVDPSGQPYRQRPRRPRVGGTAGRGNG
jgi:hypothetical protein